MSAEHGLTREQLRAGREAHRASGTPVSLALWLAAHDAEVRAEAWAVGAKAMMRAIGDTYGTLTFIAPHNPFRADAEVQAGVVAEQPEWEYGIEHVEVDGWVERVAHRSREAAVHDYSTCGMGCTLIRRRGDGPWAPAKEEPT